MSVICTTTEYMVQTLQGLILGGIATINLVLSSTIGLITALLKAAIAIIRFIIKTVISVAKWAVKAASLAITNALMNAFGPNASPADFYNNINDKWTSGREGMCNRIKSCRPLLMYLIPETVDCIPSNMTYLKAWARYYYAFKLQNGSITGSPHDVSDLEWTYFRNNALSGDDFVKLFCVGSLGDLLMGLLSLFFATDVDEILNKIKQFESAIIFQFERVRGLLRTLKLIIKEFYEKAEIMPMGYLAGCRNRKFTVKETLDYITDFAKCLCPDLDECALLEKTAKMLKIKTRTGPNCALDWNRINFDFEEGLEDNLISAGDYLDEQLSSISALMDVSLETKLDKQLGSL